MIGSQTGDAYARLTPPSRATATYGAADRPDALLFVDLDSSPAHSNDALARIRELPYATFLGITFVIARAPAGCGPAHIADMLNTLDDILPALAGGVRDWAVLEHRLGQQPQLHWRSSGPTNTPAHRDPVGPVSAALLRRARGVELSCLLETNHAIWRPSDYHFRLPDGSHASSFVRMADGIAGPRDAHVVATWLMPEIQPGRGVIFDNRTMTPVALAAQALFADRSDDIGPILFLEHAPQSQAAVERLVRDAASAGAGVLGVISVSSGGSTRDSLSAALAHMTGENWSIHTLMDRQVTADKLIPGDVDDAHTTWLGYQLVGDIIEEPDACPLCLTAQARRVVSIDPRFFDGMVLPDPTLRNLNPGAAQAAAPLWEACDEAGAVTLEHAPDDEARGRRARPEVKDGNMGVFISIDRLLTGQNFMPRVRAAIARRNLAAQPALAEVDLVIVSSRDNERAGFENAVATVTDAIGCPHAAVMCVNAGDEPAMWPADVIDAIAQSRHLLVLACGAVTGYTLQRLLVGCQEHLRAAANPDMLSGLLLHARLATRREWTTLYNSYGKRLFAVFDTPLPIGSPLREEAQTLQLLRAGLPDIPDAWRAEVNNFVRMRMEWANGERVISPGAGAPYRPLLWGMPSNDSERGHIRQHSLFGHKLGPAAFLAAIGAAVHREREEIASMSGPVWQLFEMPALLRSYYDPLIIASMLRWVRPAETWWGRHPGSVVVSLLERATEEDRWVLVPEILLAAAQGKVPLEAADQTLSRAWSMLESASAIPDEVAVAVAAAIATWQIEKARRSIAGTDTAIALPARAPSRPTDATIAQADTASPASAAPAVARAHSTPAKAARNTSPAKKTAAKKTAAKKTAAKDSAAGT